MKTDTCADLKRGWPRTGHGVFLFGLRFDFLEAEGI